MSESQGERKFIPKWAHDPLNIGMIAVTSTLLGLGIINGCETHASNDIACTPTTIHEATGEEALSDLAASIVPLGQEDFATSYFEQLHQANPMIATHGDLPKGTEVVLIKCDFLVTN